MSGGGSFSSDQTTLLLATVGADTLARAGRARVTSIQGKGIANAVLKLHNAATSGAAAAGNLVATYNFVFLETPSGYYLGALVTKRPQLVAT